jgi:hypothetical protein
MCVCLSLFLSLGQDAWCEVICNQQQETKDTLKIFGMWRMDTDARMLPDVDALPLLKLVLKLARCGKVFVICANCVRQLYVPSLWNCKMLMSQWRVNFLIASPLETSLLKASKFLWINFYHLQRE